VRFVLSPVTFLLLALYACFICPNAFAQDDICVKDGGTADCIGPDFGIWEHQASNGFITGQGLTETAAIAAYKQATLNAMVQAGNIPCELNLTDETPPLPPIGAGVGHTEVGNYGDALGGLGTYVGISWYLSAESGATRIPLKVTGKYGTQSNPACTNDYTTYAYIERHRAVFCPNPYWANGSGVSTSYCWRRSDTPDTKKGLCDHCPMSGNPTNPANGNKYQVETDYVGPNGLSLIRYYNNQMYTGQTWAPERKVFGPNWRSTYERRIRFSDSQLFPTAFADRPGGNTLHFVLANGQFKADADVADRLARLTDNGGNITGWQYTVASTEERETYDSQGRLLTITGRTGIVWTLGYDSDSRLISIVDSFGRSLTFGYTSDALTSFTDPDGKVYSYTHNAVGNVTSVTYPDSRTRTYVYAETEHTDGVIRPYALTGIIDESNSRFSTYKYNGGEWVTSTEHAGGANKYSFFYGAGYTRVTDSLSQERFYHFTNMHGVGRNTLVAIPCGDGCNPKLEAKTYDANANISSRTDLKGNKICYAYDLTRNLETVRLEGLAPGLSCPTDLNSYTPTSATRQRKIATQWHSTHRVPTQIDEFGKRTTFTHDANGNVLTRTVTDLIATPNVSRTWMYAYNSFGKVLTEDGPRTDVSDITTYTYYSCSTGFQCGQVHTVTNAAGHVTTYNTYNAHGQPLTITDSNNVLTTLTYDLRQRLKTRTVGSEVTSFDYWPTGLLKKATLPDGSYVEYTYDAAHRLTDINDADGNHIHYALDAMGNRTKEEFFDPSSSTPAQIRQRVFNTLNRLEQEIGAVDPNPNPLPNLADVTTTYVYDDNGNQTNINAPLGRNSVQGYDELNRLTQVADPLAGVTNYDYNALDQLVKVTDPRRLITSYQYSVLGDLKQQTSPDTGITTNTYDSGGNLKTSTDARNVVTTYTYDELDRVSTASFAAGGTADQVITYSYDAGTNGKGRLTGTSDANHSLAWTYDDQGRTLTATQTVGSVSRTTSYSYLNGLRQSVTTPSGQIISYGYTNGKVTSVSVNGTVLISNVLYEPFGPVRQWTWGNGTLSVRTFDQDGKLTQIDSAGLKTYYYDEAARIDHITDENNAALTWGYTYDERDYLTSASKTGTTLGYEYDENGNRKTQTGSNASTFANDLNSNRLNGITGALTRTYSYDNAGNTTSYDGIIFTYNNRGRMKSSTRNGVTTNYTYNALGQLIKKGTSALYYYDDAGHVLSVYSSTGTLTEEIVWLGGIPLATLRPKAGGGVDIYYIHSDHLSAPRVVTDAGNNVRWKWDSDPYGVGAPNDNPSGIGVFAFHLRFPGQIYFAETGLHYNYFRDYDPSTGRYIQSDPIGPEGGINTYSYTEGNPVSSSDPYGLSTLVLWRPFIGQMEMVRPSASTLDPAMIFPDTGQPNDPSSQKCLALLAKIENLRKEVYEKRIPDLQANPGNLPERIAPGERLSETVRGHRKLLNRQARRLRELEDRYQDECSPRC